MSSSESRSGPSTVQSIERAVSILEAVAAHRSIGVSALSAELGLHKTTVFRILSTLEARGMVSQVESRGHYSIGHTVTRIAAHAVEKPDVSVLARPHAVQLAAEVNETVHLSVLDGGESVTIDQVAGTSSIASIDWIGRRAPLHATAAGKVFLAYLNDGDLTDVLPDPLHRFTEHTIVESDELGAQLSAVRRDSVAYSMEEHEIGLIAVGAPIRTSSGSVVASLTVSGPAYRLTADVMPVLVDAVRKTAENISTAIGWNSRSVANEK